MNRRQLALFVLAALTGALPVRAARPPRKRKPKTHTVTEANHKESKSLRVGDTLVVRLSVRMGTGYSWAIVKNEKAVLAPQGEPKVEDPESDAPGGNETQVFLFKAVKAGRSPLLLHHRRPFEPDSPPERTFALAVTVK